MRHYILGIQASSFVKAACVAPLIFTAFLAISKLNGAERLSRPVPAAFSNHPRFRASSFVSSPGNEACAYTCHEGFKHY
jgi:hypothetical protein